MHPRRFPPTKSLIFLFLALLGSLMAPTLAAAKAVVADVVILDHVLVFNRLGAQNVNGMIYALKRDVVRVSSSGVPTGDLPGENLLPGFVTLRPDKRPRPLVLRLAAGDTLVVNFTNLLTPNANPFPPLPDEANPCVGCDPNNPLRALDNQVRDRMAGFHVQGMQLVGSIADDASNVGTVSSPGSLVGPGQSTAYTLYAEKEGTFLVTSMGATFGGEASGGNVGIGAFGAVNVQPPGSRFYRSQVSEEELRLVLSAASDDVLPIIPFGQAGVGYEARYPSDCPGGVWCREGKAGRPILNMLDGNKIVHADLNAIVAGPNDDGSFPAGTYPLESQGKRNPTVPNRLEPFREFTIIFHDETAAANAFPAWFRPDVNPVIAHTTHGVRDSFMINYGSGGIGSEIIANRLGVGPMWDCLDCAYEEFFLSAFSVGDPAMLVDVPANTGLEQCGPGDLAGLGVPGAKCGDVGPKARRAFYPDDPSNVHHSYTNDFVKFRNLHAGPKEQHIFHLHNHQWLFNANDENSNYLDAQGVGPGSGYTYEINFGGSGNRNKTAGDAIFHCHFYPHFAQGMWEMWRVHDTLELGTELKISEEGFHQSPYGLKDGTPAEGARALPDGEMVAGSPIPAVIPLPGKPLPVLPARVSLVAKNANPGVDDDPNLPGVQEYAESSQANVDRTDVYPLGHPLAGRVKNPGFPFWVAGVDCGGPAGLADPTGCRDGIVGQRPTTPPLDMLTVSDAIALRNDPVNGKLWSHPGLEASAGGFDGGLPRHGLEGFLAAEKGIPGRLDPTLVVQHQTRLDFDKELFRAKPVYFPEQGTDLEQTVMAHHAQTRHDTRFPDGSPATGVNGFRTNGALPVAGAPYAEPCIDDQGDLFVTSGEFFGATAGSFFTASPEFSAIDPRVYQAANIQVDAVFNKVGYHFPQQRILSLWQDVHAFENNLKPPEPFVIRMNTFDCTQYYHTNLVPKTYELDDYQVRTPTDVIGQHIHLPKWDLVSADGSGNGWNYEDGTLSPGAVIERIEAINHFNADGAFKPVPTLPKPDGSGGGLTRLTPGSHPFFGDAGARTTIQRWFADPVVNTDLEDRGLGIIFTHDHFGPSTHQQVGLYATVLTEPARSTWRHNETGVQLATRPDGGPTSWQAIIEPAGAGSPGLPASAVPFREFYLEFADFQHACEAGEPCIQDVEKPDSDAFRRTINPSYRQEAQPVFPDLVRFPPYCPGGVERPCPEAISADDVGMLVVNYRNEPVGLRVFDPEKTGPDGKPGVQADGLAGDLAFALQTRTDRAIAFLNTSLGQTPYPPLNQGVGPGDPFTPMLRAHYGDMVRVKIQSGATEHEHNATIHGVKWLQGGSGHGEAPNSGWRNGQNDGISEQFTFSAPLLPVFGQTGHQADYAYSVDASQDGWWSGMWGVMRAYRKARTDLTRLNNDIKLPVEAADVINRAAFVGPCPSGATSRPYDVTAVLANDVLGNDLNAVIIPNDDSATMHVGAVPEKDGGTLVYNPRTTVAAFQGPLHDPTGMLYVYTSDLVPKDPTIPACTASEDPATLPDCPVKLDEKAPIEPVVLRAAAGECLVVTLRNRLPEKIPDLAGYNTLLQMVLRDRTSAQGTTTFNNNLIRPSAYVGLHPQLVAYDVTKDDGVVVGTNPADTVVSPRGNRTYRWYAGHLEGRLSGTHLELRATPVELGGANLTPADKVKQGQKGLVGALIVEPEGATWTTDLQLAGCGHSGQPRCARAGASVFSPLDTTKGGFRDFAVVFQKGLNLRYDDGSAVENIASEGGNIPEDSHDAGQSGINYGTEPAWFRFGLRANTQFGNGPGELGAVANAHELYSNQLAGGDPATPVFYARPNQQSRMRVLLPTGAGRGTTFDVHGHLWQRDPYLEGTVPSQTIGTNPLGFYLGGQESVTPSAHFDVVLRRSGGVYGVQGDYLVRDHASFGNTNGLWAIFRVLSSSLSEVAVP
jgi:hypothetical protein